MSEQYLSVQQVNNYIKNIFDAEVRLQNICMYGEVSSYKISNNIAYFNLADSNSIISCVLFNANRFNEPAIGDKILAVGSVSYYVKGGRLSFNANHIAPYGKGILYENFLQLKNMLEQKGYFKEEIKKPLPARVKKIGVVTSATGAVIQDIINVVTRRNKTVSIALYPVKVQGVGAEQEIAEGINFFNNYDVNAVIVARGGGSAEDMQPFNTELVATAVFNANKPIVSGVGHETDFTIIDFVADFRAPTPSAAAECLVHRLEDDLNFITTSIDNSYKIVKAMINNNLEKCSNILNNIYYTSKSIFFKKLNLINDLTSNIKYNIDKALSSYENIIKVSENKLISLNPNLCLKKGYVKVEKENKNIISSKQIVKGENYSLIFADGKSEVVGV